MIMHENAIQPAGAAGQGKVELSKGDKILRFIGWLGGFYSLMHGLLVMTFIMGFSGILTNMDHWAAGLTL